MTNHVLGVDISKASLDVHLAPTGEIQQFANSTEGFRRLIAWLRDRPVSRVVYEPTGPWHRDFERALGKAGLPLSRVNPLQARRFAQALGQLGLAVLLKFFQVEGRFPHYHKEVPLPAVDHVAQQLEVPASAWFDYPLKGRSGSRDREQLRAFLGFRQAANDDMEPVQRWLSQEVVPQDQDPRHLRSAVLDWYREHFVESPSSDRIDRIISAALHSFETAFFAGIHRQLSCSTRQRLDALLVSHSADQPATESAELSDFVTLGRLKADPGRAGLASLREEIAKLECINDVQLPDTLFVGVPHKVLERYRLRVSGY